MVAVQYALTGNSPGPLLGRHHITMRQITGFLSQNWFTILSILSLGIYQFGFRERDYRAVADFGTETRQIQAAKIKEFESYKQDVERLKWELARQDRSIDEMKIDVKSTSRDVADLKENMRVVIELLKPRGDTK